MRLINQHTKFLQLLCAVLFFLASTGFTTVLHDCLMPGMSCCSEPSMMAGKVSAGGDTHGDVVLSSLSSSCCEITVAGGLNQNPGVIEKVTQDHVRLECLMVVILSDDNVSLHSSSQITLPQADAASLLSPVEKYILHSSYLI